MEVQGKGMVMRPILLLPVALALVSCGSASQRRPSGKGDAPVVYVSILPQAGLARRLVGDAMRVEVLVAPGQNPHNFQPTVRQMADVSAARVWLTLGTPFEQVLVERLRAAAPALHIVNTADGVEWLHYGDTIVEIAAEEAQEQEHAHGADCRQAHGAGAVDEHLWLSPRRMRTVVSNMAAALAGVMPGEAAAMRARQAQIDAEWDALDRELAEVLAPLRGQTILAYHGAFGYLAHDYGLRLAAVEFGGREPSPARIERLTRLVRDHRLRAVFVQPQFPVDSARILAEGTGAVVVPLDDLPEDLIGGLRALAQAVRHGGTSLPALHE